MELRINGQIVDIGNSTPAITKKSIDINNPSARFIDYTNKFILPDTAKNRRVFNSPLGIGTNNKSFNKYFDAELYDVFLIFKGYGTLTSADKNTISFQLIDNSKAVFNALNKKLNAVNWDDNDTILTQAAIDAQDTYDSDNCWIWGKMCCHTYPSITKTDQTTGDNRCKYSRPQFNVNALLKRALDAEGYTFIEPDEYLAISSNHKQFYFTDYQKSFSDVTFNPSGTLAITGWDTYDFKTASVTALNGSVKGIQKHNYRIRGTFTSSENIYLQIYSIDQTSSKPIYNKIKLPENGFLDYVTSEIYDGVQEMTTTFTLVGTGSVTFDDVLIYKIVDENNADLSTNPFLDSYIKVYDNLSDDLTYLDLYRLICILFNKYPIINIKNKTFSFGSFSNLNKISSVNWSEKFVIGSEQIKNNYSRLYKKNICRYENDITVAYSYGESYFFTDNESLKDEGDYIVINFGSSIDIIVDSNLIAQVEIYNDESRVIDREINKRVFLIEDDRLVFDNLHWITLINQYYKNLFGALSRVRMLTASFNLKKLDVLAWHEKQLIYIDYFKTVFIVTEISNFIPDIPTKVKLLEYGRALNT